MQSRLAGKEHSAPVCVRNSWQVFWPWGQQIQPTPASISNCQRGMTRGLHGLPRTAMAGILVNSRFPQLTGVARISMALTLCKLQTGPQAP